MKKGDTKRYLQIFHGPLNNNYKILTKGKQGNHPLDSSSIFFQEYKVGWARMEVSPKVDRFAGYLQMFL